MKTQKSNQHRLLQETIRLIIREDIKVKDLRAALAATKKEKNIDKAIEVAKEVGKKGMMALLKQIPVAGNVVNALEDGMDIKDLIDAAMKSEPEEKKANPLWDRLTIDPDTSAIVDDGVESEFISVLGDRARLLDDDDELPDADIQLASYLKGKYSGTHIKK